MLWIIVIVFSAGLAVPLVVVARGDLGYTVVALAAMAPFVALSARFLRVRLELHDEGVVVCNYGVTRRLEWSAIEQFVAVPQGRKTTLAWVRGRDGSTTALYALRYLQAPNVYTGETEAAMIVRHLNELLAHRRSSTSPGR